jgi:hypothetical protein
MQVALRHPSTGNFKFIDTGWSWSIFLGAFFLGLPLFFRGLALWGTLMLVLWCLQLAVTVAVADGSTLEWILNLAVIGLSFYLGFRGNALSARHFLACGYEFVEPDSPGASVAAEQWNI